MLPVAVWMAVCLCGAMSALFCQRPLVKILPAVVQQVRDCWQEGIKPLKKGKLESPD